jgi:glycosyltransferase involved in cell wall biosynthesis
MKHLIISREYPPASYAPGGIGTYVMNIARLLAERGEIIHVIGERWSGAPNKLEVTCDGRLYIHRIGKSDLPPSEDSDAAVRLQRELDGLKKTTFPDQWFAWHAALVTEKLIEDGAVDVVEGQDWEAPLYYLLLRRALGLGPTRSPPCIVHLHSPSEFVWHFNGAVNKPPHFTVMKRMEEFCIRAADALLCPSRYLARQCCEQYGLPPERIKVIHLPGMFAPPIERKPQVWAQGSICFVGRVEPRKGVIEWLEAAMRVAHEDPTVYFDFVGAEMGLQRLLVNRLPRALRTRFRFYGSKPREELPRFLASARAAVVPSRWENFPNVCIEAMSVGLPVIATRLGGMVELVEDGRTGWLAAETGVAGMVDGLAEALRRCLATSADERASMGRAAAEAVRRICDNDRIADEQLAFRAEVCRLGIHPARALSGLSRCLPRNVRTPGPVAQQAECGGAGIVLRVDRLADAARVLESLGAQTIPPRAIAIVCSAPPSETDAERTRLLMSEGLTVLANAGHPDPWNLGLSASPRMGGCRFYLFLDEHDRLLPDCLECVDKVLQHRPDVGIVSFWTEATGVPTSLNVRPCPLLSYQLRDNDVCYASAFRAEAIGRTPPFRAGMPRGYDVWDVANMVMARGWLAVTYPRLLARRYAGKAEIRWPEATALRALRVELLRRISRKLDPDLLDLIDDFVPIPLAVPETRPASILLDLAKHLAHPRRAGRAVVRRLRAVLANSDGG